MDENHDFETAISIDEGALAIQAEIEQTAKAVERIAAADRIGFHKQLDLLTQRSNTVTRELKHLGQATDPAEREDIRQRAAAELDELGKAVRQVAERVRRQVDSPNA